MRACPARLDLPQQVGAAIAVEIANNRRAQVIIPIGPQADGILATIDGRRPEGGVCVGVIDQAVILPICRPVGGLNAENIAAPIAVEIGHNGANFVPRPPGA